MKIEFDLNTQRVSDEIMKSLFQFS